MDMYRIECVGSTYRCIVSRNEQVVFYKSVDSDSDELEKIKFILDINKYTGLHIRLKDIL